MLIFGLLLVLLTALPGGLGLILLLAGVLWYTLRPFLPEKTVQTIAFAIITCATLAVLAILVIILQDIIINGIPALSWEFLTQSPLDSGRAGGIYPAIIGTLYLVVGAIAIALPLGVGAAIYLVEYTREGRVTQLIRTGVDLLNGTPSIVFGLFGFAFIVLYLNVGVSMLAGQVTLALMVLPTVIRTTEESLKSIPQLRSARGALRSGQRNGRPSAGSCSRRPSRAS